jgi:hypothetical protein
MTNFSAKLWHTGALSPTVMAQAVIADLSFYGRQKLTEKGSHKISLLHCDVWGYEEPCR